MCVYDSFTYIYVNIYMTEFHNYVLYSVIFSTLLNFITKTLLMITLTSHHLSPLSFTSVLQSEKLKSLSRVQLFATPWTTQSMEFSRPEYWRVGSLSLLQGIFPTQGSNPGLLHCRQILYQLSHNGSQCFKVSTFNCIFFHLKVQFGED